MSTRWLPIVLLAASVVESAPPDEVQQLTFCPASRDCLQWSADPGDESYRLYRGDLFGLPALTDIAIDSCLLDSPIEATSGPQRTEAPDPGGLLWYLVNAVNGDGEGSSGGARILDPDPEPCPFVCNPDYAAAPHVGSSEAPGQGGCPAGMNRVDAFCVDRYEASLVTVPDGRPWSPYFHPGAQPMRAVSVAGAVPQAYIDRVSAAAACAQAGKRLCTDAEWLRACRGPTMTTYPYGDTAQPGSCNDQRATHPAVEYFGTTEPWIFSELDQPCLDQLPDSVAATGANAGCVSAESLFDMVGNLHEWTADTAGTFRGGYYVEAQINGAGCLYSTTAHATTHWDFGTGFRCCADP